jgi:hypothetical protein
MRLPKGCLMLRSQNVICRLKTKEIKEKLLLVNNKVESAEARGREQRNVFLPLVSVFDHALINQQFVNCAYLEILSLCPALSCLAYL